MYALWLVCQPVWNNDTSLKTIHDFYDTFEDLVAFSESEEGKFEGERFAYMNDSKTYGYDYCEVDTSSWPKGEREPNVVYGP